MSFPRFIEKSFIFNLDLEAEEVKSTKLEGKRLMGHLSLIVILGIFQDQNTDE
jgi:hypothetical protein